MKKIISLAMLACIACASIACAIAAPAATMSEDAKFQSIYEKEWTWRKTQFPGSDDDDNDRGVAQSHLTSVDAATQNKRLTYWEGILHELDGVDAAKLSADNKVNLDVYRPQLENFVAALRLRDYEMPFNSDSAFWSDLGFIARRTLTTPKDFENYIGQLNDIPRYFDEQITNMRAGIKRGFTIPRAVLDGRDGSIAAVADLKDATASEFYAPFRKMPASISAEQQETLRKQATQALREKVIPAYAKLLRFFRTDYLPHARTTLAAEALPDGKAFYRQQIREYTTLDLDPDAIHQTGLDEVKRIDAQMRDAMHAAKFEGTFPEFLQFLRSDPQFYPKTGEELLMRAAWIAKRVDAKLSQFFGLIPRGRFGIEPVPADIAPYWTAGRGSAHTYWLNTYNLPSRPLYNLPALTLHESAPGHSFQGSLVEEQKQQPPFRRHSYISAYGEGWALYTEKLGEEMGIYTTPYEEFGRLTYENWRACRLVIDTGIHHLGWTRDQALAYLREHTALSEHEVTTEIDRYISWPGQALSYKLGEIKIIELRKLAESELGPAFDIRAFHDAVLAQGSVPLPTLESQIREFIAASKAKAAEASTDKTSAGQTDH